MRLGLKDFKENTLRLSCEPGDNRWSIVDLTSHTKYIYDEKKEYKEIPLDLFEKQMKKNYVSKDLDYIVLKDKKVLVFAYRQENKWDFEEKFFDEKDQGKYSLKNISDMSEVDKLKGFKDVDSPTYTQIDIDLKKAIEDFMIENNLKMKSAY